MRRSFPALFPHFRLHSLDILFFFRSFSVLFLSLYLIIVKSILFLLFFRSFSVLFLNLRREGALILCVPKDALHIL